jgi:hypothetical protein
VVASVAISVPVIGVGFAAESFGLYDAALVFAIAIGTLTLVTEAITLAGPTRARLGVGSPAPTVGSPNTSSGEAADPDSRSPERAHRNAYLT